MKRFHIPLIAFCLIPISCSKDEIRIDPDNLLIGTWNYVSYRDTVSVYARSTAFQDSHCYKFNPDGTLVERNISGWCATPPVSYENYEGNWEYLDESHIQVTVDYWGGTRDYNLTIISVDRDTLLIR